MQYSILCFAPFDDKREQGDRKLWEHTQLNIRQQIIQIESIQNEPKI